MKTIPDVLDAAKRVTEFIQTHQKTPKFVRVDKENIEPAPFNRMLAATVLEIHNKTNRNILNLPIKPAPAPTSTLTEGQLQLPDYIDVANRANIFSKQKQTWPNFITSKMGNIDPDQFMDMYSRILNFYADRETLPRFVYTESLTSFILPTTPPLPRDLQLYLTESRNCQVNHPTIQNLAKQLKNPKAAFNWTRDNLAYTLPIYYNTRYGAVGTVNARQGNCCDQSHALIAIYRANGIPARYKHVRADYGNNVYGHVYVEAYLEGKWHGLDPSSSRNTFESINRWKLDSNINTYRELPF
jgi:hypothetical protein